jgi:hypothetical protein
MFSAAEMEAVTKPRFRKDISRSGGIWFDLLSDTIDKHTRVLDLAAVIGTPNRLEELDMRDGFVRTRDQRS